VIQADAAPLRATASARAERKPLQRHDGLLIRGRHQVAGAEASAMPRDQKTSLAITDTPLSSGRYAFK